MNPTKRLGSIARKIRRSRVILLLGAFFWLDVVLCALCAGTFCYWAETRDGGAFDFLHTQRRVEMGDPLTGGRYIYCARDGRETEVSLDPFFPWAIRCGAVLGGFELLFLLGQFFGGRKSARRILRPLQNMADTAQQLTRPAPDERLHHLEDALQSVPPGTHLFTGDPDLKELEDAVNRLLDRTRASYEEQVRFASDASHELRTPISVIQGYANMLARWGKSDPQVLDESVTAIQAESARMKKLVEQLLFLARGDADRQKVNMTEVDLSRMLTEIRDECQMIDDTHAWKLDVPEGAVVCAGDEDMLTQTVRILTDNARKFTPEGGTIRLKAGLKNGSPFFEVQDEGAGIEKEHLPKIFDRFYRSDPSREGQSGGTGLGLAIAKWIVERHGGYFEVVTGQQMGTRMRVVLPPKADPGNDKQKQGFSRE